MQASRFRKKQESENHIALRSVSFACWEFKWKVQQAMQSSKKHPIIGEVHVDEFFIGGPEEQKKGRSKGDRRLVVIALEKVNEGVGRAYAKIIEHASAVEFRLFFNDYIGKEARVVRVC